jgi:hypothetical protein
MFEDNGIPYNPLEKDALIIATFIYYNVHIVHSRKHQKTSIVYITTNISQIYIK